jgi:transcription-repair coupling factor (superfamily II helicase)
LSTDQWKKKKSKVREKLESIAGDLLKVSAEREMTKGFAFSKDDENQAIFDSEFIYSETDDQLKAISLIKTEMEKEKPMDMLLCGDVGYGKTEVAFRAMFKAINDGKQVAYLCPTTILSNQQYESAKERFATFPVNIGLINRFVDKSKQSKILDDLQNGKIDILFGTHRLLSDDVKFKDLGLLVVDEEQRFGVTHKEKIKSMKANVDVLTLSATPIPRTLQMSMTGIRSLALIETPPKERYPIQTYVMEESNLVIRDAIYKELSRDGQVFILFNSVMNIARELGATSFSLEVRVSNIPAQKLYLKSGYKESGIRKGYYSDGENAIVMIKEEGDEHYEQVYYGDRK